MNEQFHAVNFFLLLALFLLLQGRRCGSFSSRTLRPVHHSLLVTFLPLTFLQEVIRSS